MNIPIDITDTFDAIIEKYAQGNISGAKDMMADFSLKRIEKFEEYFTTLKHYEALDNDTDAADEFLQMMVVINQYEQY